MTGARLRLTSNIPLMKCRIPGPQLPATAVKRSATCASACAAKARREQYIPLVAFCLRHFLADFIICMCEFDFRQAQGEPRDVIRHRPTEAGTTVRPIDQESARLQQDFPVRNLLVISILSSANKTAIRPQGG